MENKKISELNYTPYELSEQQTFFYNIMSANSTVPFDYGTGEKYTSVEVHTVTYIYLNPGITAKEIADKTLRTQSAVSQTLNKLLKKELIYVSKDPEDSRRCLLYATEKGEHLSKTHIQFDERGVGERLEKAIEKFGIDAVNRYIDIMKIFMEK